MIHRFASRTDCGRLRQNNEDAVAVLQGPGLAVLADGMGGYKAGEVASAMATSLVGAELSRWVAEAPPLASEADASRAVVLAVENANLAIWSAGQVNADCSGMGTTVVVALFGDGRLLLAHVGDSRAYRLRDGELAQLTCDHSLLQEQIDAGLLTPEEALTAPNRNLVTRALGVEAVVNVELHGHAISPGDLYLLCSDGLTDMLRDDEIAAVLYEGRDLAEMADSLIETANLHGGRDNISVVLVRSQDGAPGAG